MLRKRTKGTVSVAEWLTAWDIFTMFEATVELDSEFKFRWLHFLSIVDEIRDAINDPVTRQGVGNT